MNLFLINLRTNMHKYIQKRLKKIHKLAVAVEMVCEGVGSLTKTKDAVTEIMKISAHLLKKNDKG